MKKFLSVLFSFLLALSVFVVNSFAAVGWDDDKPADTKYIDEAFVELRENQDAIELALGTHRQNTEIVADTASQFTVNVGSVSVTNATDYLFLGNTSSTSVTWSDLDTGSEASSTTYYVYAGTSTVTDVNFSIKISTSSSAPTGMTYYRRLGSFYNDGSSNITQISNDDIVPLNFYDSGYFSVSTASSYTKTHNLGTTNYITALFYSSNSGGTGNLHEVKGMVNNGAGFSGATFKSMTSTQITLQTGSTGVAFRPTSGGNADLSPPSSGYYRIIMLAVA